MLLWKPLAERIIIALLTVLMGALLSATLARYSPGFGADERLLDARLSHESAEAIRQEHAEERAIMSYYVGALRRMLRGDLGTSRTLQRPVKELLQERTPVTLRLLAAGLAIAWTAALLLIAVSWRADCSGLDMTFLLGTGALLCLPVGAVALLLLMANAPAFLAIALVVFPKFYRYLHNLVRAAEAMPHVVAARAQGAGAGRLLLWHIAPVIRREMCALAGVSVGVAVGASIPVEALCGTAGIGQLAWQAALGRDVPVLLSVSVLVIATTVLANSGSDLLAGAARQSP